jgi:peptidoglycan hydrolase-like protein with peptidoglycan-binding domain
MLVTSTRNRILVATSLVALAGIATAQNSAAPAKTADKQWVAPGTPGSEIDGKAGMVNDKAIKGFQEARGLQVSGKLDQPTRAALLQNNRPSTVMVKLTGDDISGSYVYPFPTKPEAQAKLKYMAYRNMIEEVAERYHTTPRTLVALNGPTALIGIGQTLRLPNVIPKARDYASSSDDKAKAIMAKLNVDSNQPAGDHIVVDKSEGVLKVMDAADKLVAQFPVTTGSSHDPLPLGNWKVTTYSFLPPFHYQPDLFWDVADSKDEQRLPPGPNGPVGVAWLDLTKDHYGIHGTSAPETIGRAESHGCLRLTNWDVLRLSQMLKPGFKAVFQA